MSLSIIFIILFLVAVMDLIIGLKKRNKILIISSILIFIVLAIAIYILGRAQKQCKQSNETVKNSFHTMWNCWSVFTS
jgi:cytosine/uracil/thiamine/allantoin permease